MASWAPNAAQAESEAVEGYERVEPDPKPQKRSKGTRKVVRCPDCGETREIWFANTREPKRCRSCHAASRRDSRTRDITCPCGTLVKQKPGRTRRYCSMSCRREYGGYEASGRKMSAARKGHGNPAYKHGRRSGANIPGWNRQAKGEFNCRNCGSADRVELHHAIPRGKCRAAATDLRNGLPLCMKCHRGWHAHKVVLYRDLFREDEWEFLRSVSLTGENIEAWLDGHYPSRSQLQKDFGAILKHESVLDDPEWQRQDAERWDRARELDAAERRGA